MVLVVSARACGGEAREELPGLSSDLGVAGTNALTRGAFSENGVSWLLSLGANCGVLFCQ